MNKSRITYLVLALILGVFMFVYGGADDSPGAQLLGVLIVATGVFFFIKNKKKTTL